MPAQYFQKTCFPKNTQSKNIYKKPTMNNSNNLLVSLVQSKECCFLSEPANDMDNILSFQNAGVAKGYNSYIWPKAARMGEILNLCHNWSRD